MFMIRGAALNLYTSRPEAYVVQLQEIWLYCYTMDSKELGEGFTVIYAGVPSSLGFGVRDNYVPAFWLLL